MFKIRNPAFIFYKYIDYKAVDAQEHYFEFIFQGNYYSHTFCLRITETDEETQYESGFSYTEIKEDDINIIEGLYSSVSNYFIYNPKMTFLENVQTIMESDFETARIIKPHEVMKHIILCPRQKGGL